MQVAEKIQAALEAQARYESQGSGYAQYARLTFANAKKGMRVYYEGDEWTISSVRGLCLYLVDAQGNKAKTDTCLSADRADAMVAAWAEYDRINASPVDATNFHIRTKATFTPCETPTTPADYVSASGSLYWYTRHGVIRSADHWGQCASCEWWLEGQNDWFFPGTGYAPWDAFTRV
jgi:hypothetical protein